MTVRRVLPSQKVEAIGPFVFVDHIGPMPSPRQSLPAHPHAGIEVITYLMKGHNEHRDSLGHIGRTSSGGAQWLTAGRGMLHAERIGDAEAKSDDDDTFHAVQLWTRLPAALEDCAPSYRAVLPDQVPEWRGDGALARLIAGQHALFSDPGPVQLQVKALLVHVRLDARRSLQLVLDLVGEYGIYVLSGSMQVAGEIIRPGQCLFLTSRDQVVLEAALGGPAECLLLGGTPAERPLVYAGSFVFGSQHKADIALQAFRDGAMGTLDGVPF